MGRPSIVKKQWPLSAAAVFLATAALIATPVLGQRQTNAGRAKSLVITVDPRVELMCILAGLAGYEEYGLSELPAYKADVDKHFVKFQQHEAVVLARELRARRGIGYDAVMQMAVAVKDAFLLEPIHPWDSALTPLDERWTVSDAAEFVKRARRFVVDAKFKDFVNAHAGLYEESVSRLSAVVEKESFVGWFENYFGGRPGGEFAVVIGLQNGPSSYGARITVPPKGETVYSILGADKADDKGIPVFSSNLAGTIVHEFSHSYVNPLVKKHESALRTSGERIYALVAADMKSMAYGRWDIVQTESIIRACGIRRTLAEKGKEAAEKLTAWEERNKFYWIRGLADLLGTYEAQRDRYPDLDSFFPRIIEFLNAYALRADAEIQAVKDRWENEFKKMAASSPKILSMSPLDGAQDVDPGLTEIKIIFDRPMKDGMWAVMTLSASEGEFPQITGKVRYESGRTAFFMPVKLKPDTVYAFGLNDLNRLVFQSEKNDPLVPTKVRFKTRK